MSKCNTTYYILCDNQRRGFLRTSGKYELPPEPGRADPLTIAKRIVVYTLMLAYCIGIMWFLGYAAGCFIGYPGQ